MNKFFLYRLPRRLFTSITTLVLAILISLENSAAQSIVINDCQGFTRAAKDVPASSTNQVAVEVVVASAAASSVEVTLTNRVTGFAQQKLSQGGKVVFEEVSPGTYVLTVSKSDVTLAAVSIGEAAGLTVGAAAGVVALTGVTAAAGTAGVVIGVHNATDGNPKRMVTPSPTPQVTPTATPKPPPASPPPPLDDCQCDPDARPTPLDEDDFFKDKQQLQQREVLSPNR